MSGVPGDTLIEPHWLYRPDGKPDAVPVDGVHYWVRVRPDSPWAPALWRQARSCASVLGFWSVLGEVCTLLRVHAVGPALPRPPSPLQGW